MAPRTIHLFDEQRISQVLSRKKGFIAALVGLFLAIGGSAYGAPRTSGLWWMPDVAGTQAGRLCFYEADVVKTRGENWFLFIFLHFNRVIRQQLTL